MVEYIDDHKQEFGVEPICRVLTEHGCTVSSSTYYDARNREQSTRSVRDEELTTEIARLHEENYSVYGARKVWLQLARENITVARCTVEGLMGDLGLEGARRGKRKRTTVADPQAHRADDLVERQLNPVTPNVLWVADFTYVSAWSGGCTWLFRLDRASAAHG
jgi:putative transposase